MKFGLLKTTLLDYPGRVASVIFTPLCNLRCPYCHNPELVFNQDDSDLLSREEISAFLNKRASVLGGVVISGGEPLLHGEVLIELIEEIHSHNLKVKIDTNGLFPGWLPKLKADFIAMDLKTSPKRYEELGFKGDNCGELLDQSARYIKESGVAHQFRTTLSEDLVSPEDINLMVPLLSGCSEHRITPFKPGHTLSEQWQKKAPPKESYINLMVNLFKEKGIPSYLA
jgi:pyruvate formate lyase activating enzyme